MIGIIGAMQEEVDSLIDELQDMTWQIFGNREFYKGTLKGVPVVVVHSRIGKVAAAITTTILINEFYVDCVLFTGVAGSADPKVNIGDVVVGTHLYQHDMDASPLYERHQIPMLNTDRFFTDSKLTDKLAFAAEKYGVGKVWRGAIASGDKFFASKEELSIVKERLPDIMCVEMEGAAVAQVCFEHQVSFGIFRTISDTADHTAPLDFPKFIEDVARKYAIGILSIAAPLV